MARRDMIICVATRDKNEQQPRVFSGNCRYEIFHRGFIHCLTLWKTFFLSLSLYFLMCSRFSPSLSIIESDDCVGAKGVFLTELSFTSWFYGNRTEETNKKKFSPIELENLDKRYRTERALRKNAAKRSTCINYNYCFRCFSIKISR